MATVVLTREQRDGLHGFVTCHLGRDLSHAAHYGDERFVKETAEILPRCIRVLDQLGWEEDGMQEEYSLRVDPDLLRLVADIRPNIEGTIRDDLDYLKGADAEQHAQGSRLLALDSAGRTAAELIEKTVA
jgi:hypothetical protein